MELAATDALRGSAPVQTCIAWVARCSNSQRFIRGITKRAFTLVELLVVIAIIAVLLALLLPVLSKVRAQSELAKCKAQIRQQIQAIYMYANDYRGAKPPMFCNIT